MKFRCLKDVHVKRINDNLRLHVCVVGTYIFLPELGCDLLNLGAFQASEEIRDPRLKMHILTVLRSMQSTRKKANSSANLASLGNSEAFLLVDGPNNLSMELFAIIAECEKQKYPGGALLNKAKNMRWPFLAIVASCFPDVSPLSSLIVWLEITAAR